MLPLNCEDTDVQLCWVSSTSVDPLGSCVEKATVLLIVCATSFVPCPFVTGWLLAALRENISLMLLLPSNSGRSLPEKGGESFNIQSRNLFPFSNMPGGFMMSTSCTSWPSTATFSFRTA